MKKILLGLTLLTSVSSFANSSCADGMRLAPNGEGQLFCLKESITLPKSGEPRAYCEHVADGYIGFLYNLNFDNRKYDCPEGMRQAPNGEGQIYCLLEDLPVSNKTNLDSYCDFLNDGYIGYLWDQ